MSSNQRQIREHYSAGEEEGRVDRSRYTGEEFYYTQKYLSPLIGPDARVLELGCGTGYYGLLFAPHCAAYCGVDITPENIALFREKIQAAGMENVRAEVGDATELRNISDESFDVVLALGPMYHLPREERQMVFQECCRLARQGAAVAFSYINAIGVYAGACANERWRHIYPNAKSNHYVFDLCTDDERPEVFYYTSPEEMEEDSIRNGLIVVENHELDFFFEASAVEGMSDEQFACYRELADRMSASRSCVGLANHALLICKKG